MDRQDNKIGKCLLKKYINIMYILNLVWKKIWGMKELNLHLSEKISAYSVGIFKKKLILFTF